MKLRQEATKAVNKAYFERTASGAMRRSLCQFPTQAGAQEAGMSLREYEQFVYSACRLDEDDPVAAWLEVRKEQQRYVDRLNVCNDIHYKSADVDIRFSCKGRTWINSDGKANMPSGEVFTGPIEDSVNGRVKFTYPAIVMGNEVEGVELTVKDGRVERWSAKRGQDLLDHIFTLDGARYFGEVAVGTNYRIQRFTKNILFDEKIGGTIHMAIGQSYIQTGGKNQSPIHIDLIADMKNGGEITADGEVIYRDGKFVI
jgi:aminopeptidase